MWSEQLSNGKVKFIERYTDPLTLKLHRVSCTMVKDTNSTRKQAQAILAEKIEQKLEKISMSAAVRKEKLRLDQLCTMYNTFQKTARAPSTYSRNLHACNSLCRILGEDTLVSQLTAGYVNEKLAEQNEAVGTTNERITRFKALIRWGYENDYIADIAWINKIRKEKDIKKKETLEDKYLEREELQTLLNNLTVPRWRMLASFAALSGLRVGEIIALRDSDVNLDKRIISVTKNYDSNNKVIGYTKTSCSYREVYIQDELLTLCRQIRFFIKKEQLLTGVRSPLFIPDVSGDHVHYWAYNKCLKETAHRVLNKDVEITTHVLRHTHVALMAEQLVPLEVISRRIGHADSKVTREIYFHITKKMRERDNQLIRNVKIL